VVAPAAVRAAAPAVVRVVAPVVVRVAAPAVVRVVAPAAVRVAPAARPAGVQGVMPILGMLALAAEKGVVLAPRTGPEGPLTQLARSVSLVARYRAVRSAS